MAKISFRGLPLQLRKHIEDRVRDRNISVADLVKLQRWLALEPEAPEGNWFKDFGTFKLCGTAEMPKTVLLPDMKAHGEEIQ